MNTRIRKLIVSATLAASVMGAGGFAYTALADSGSSSSPSATRLVTASLGSVQSTVSTTGTLAPATSLDLNFENAGTLTAVNVKVGDTVTAGQVLAKIDDAAAEVALETAKADRLAAQAKLNTAQSATTVDATAVAQAKAALHAADLDVDEAQEALDATVLKASSSGTITALNYEVGQKVSGGGTTTTASSSSSSGTSESSTAFATLVDSTTMVVDVSWAEADASDVSVGQTASITVDSLSQTVQGTVTSIATTSTVVDNVVTYAGVVTLDDVPDSLKTGMTATVTVVSASKDGVIAVPSAAITTTGGISTVKVSAGGQTTTRTVTLGLKGDSTTEIVSGLSAGEQVVISIGAASNPASSSASPSASFGGGGGAGGGFSGPPPGAQ